MKRRLCRSFFLLLLLTGLCGCQKEAPWKPVVEPSGFGYLDETVAEAMEAHQELAAQLERGDREGTLKALAASRHSLLKLQRYFIPMTEVRQLVYDADRLYFLRRTSESKDKLVEARKLLHDVAAANGSALESEVGRVEAMIDALRTAMEQEPSRVPELFASLGPKVNLLLLKGDLVLAGVRFTGER